MHLITCTDECFLVCRVFLACILSSLLYLYDWILYSTCYNSVSCLMCSIASLAPTWTVCCMLLLWLKYCMHILLTRWRPTICCMLAPHTEPLNVNRLFPVSTSLRSNNKDCTEAVCLYSSQCEYLYRNTVLQSWEGTGVNPGSHLSLDPTSITVPHSFLPQ